VSTREQEWLFEAVWSCAVRSDYVAEPEAFRLWDA